MKHSLSKQAKYYAEWLAVAALFAVLKRLPITTASNFGGWLARNIGPHLKVNRVARRNLQMAFPEWDDATLNQTVHDMWDNLGRYGAEFPHIASLSTEAFTAMVEMEGLEHLLAAKHSDSGTLIFSCHMANWEIGIKAAWEMGFPVSGVYRPLNNPKVNHMVDTYRNRYQTSGVAKTSKGGRALLQILKNKGAVALLLDQKMNTGIPVPFFGRDAMTSASIADLSLKFGYPILPARVERIGKAPQFKVTVYPPLEYEKTGNDKADAKAIMQTIHHQMETWIRERPEQWFWLHKRWG